MDNELSELIDWYNHNKYNSYIKDCEEYKKICSLTSFLDNHYEKIPLSQRIWHIKNNYYELKKCKYCGKVVTFYRKYEICCSKKCSNLLGENMLAYKKTCLKRYGVENTFQLEKTKINRKLTKTDKESAIKNYKKTCLERYGVDNYAKTKKSIEYSILVFNNKFKEIFERDGYVKDGYEYVKRLGKRLHLIKCPKCGKEFEMHVTKLYGNRKFKYEICTNCNPLQKHYSSSEKEISDYVKSIYSREIIENSRKIIYPYELDIYLPELNLAIEYNGLYWHSSDQKDKNYHKMKSDLCKEKGIHLIHIFEDDWVYKQEICKSVLSNFINPSNNQKIYARKCSIKEVSFKDVNLFLTNNHLLGSVSAFSKCYGLYYNDELVSLMTFKLISRKTNQYELQRYAIKKYTTIIGGAERLLKQFIKNVDYSSIITYNDNSVFKGDIYPKLGFRYIRTNSPNYMFIDNSKKIIKRFSKQSIRKLKVGYSIETEKELGLLRVYNAGNDVYVYDSF